MNKKQFIYVKGVEFSVQELSVVDMLRKGASYKDISEKLGISVKAIDYHIKNIKEKTKTNSKEEIIKFFNEKKKADKKKETISQDDKKFIKALSVVFGILLVSVVVFYPSKKKFIEVTNVSNFTDNFLDRPYLESKVIQKLKWQNGIKTVVIYGMGGGGKTTVARKVISLISGEVKFEVNAETEKTLYNSFMELADNIVTTEEQRKEIDIIRGLSDSSFRKKRLIRLVSSVLKSKVDWVLLFDNVGSFDQIIDYFPVNDGIWGNGTVLITSRNQNLGESNYIKREYMVDVGHLEDHEKKELFSNIVYNCRFVQLSSVEQRRVSEFLSVIPEFPLDVCAVAYYIKNTNISLEEYSSLLKQRVNKLNAAQQSLIKENSGYSGTRYGIITSSLKSIVGDKKENKLLLFAISLMDSQGIPKHILKNVVNSVEADGFLNKLREHSLIQNTGSEIFMHRSNHRIAYDYIRKSLSKDELDSYVELISEVIFNRAEEKLTFVPHLESVLDKISQMHGTGIVKAKSKLLLLMAEILRNKSYKMSEATNCLEKVLAINSNEKCLDRYLLARVKSRLGELYTITNRNALASKYLRASLNVFDNNDIEKVRAYYLLGIVQMRQNDFEDANRCFILALDYLKALGDPDIYKGIIESKIYEYMSMNYFMAGINREKARIAIEIMKKAINVLRDEKFDKNEEAVTRRGVQKIKLSSIYNALASYQDALDLASETEKMINSSGYENADTQYIRGLIARERGVANLRLNNVSKAYSYLLESRDAFEKLMKRDYLSKLKIHEAECLIRLDRLGEAMNVCESLLNEVDRERNNYSDLCYNTGLYHAAIIEFRRGNFESSRQYFQKFFREMRELCLNVLEKQSYKKLTELDVFNENVNDFAKYFENSLKVFEAIYWKNYEFIKYYVERNLSLVNKVSSK